MGQYVEPVFRKKIKKYKKGDFQELVKNVQIIQIAVVYSITLSK